MRLGIAEIDQHAVAHILGDKTAKAGEGVGDAAMVGAVSRAIDCLTASLGLAFAESLSDCELEHAITGAGRRMG
jgi:hypothetical protein